MDEDACATTGLAPACAGADLDVVTDLSLLVHRAGLGMRCAIDRACREVGLNDGRDWLLLDAVADGGRRTQLELSRLLGIDKTTLTAVLDRLERAGLVVRRADPADRRTRLPEATPAGLAARAAVSRARDELEHDVLRDVPAELHGALRELLLRLARAGERTSV